MFAKENGLINVLHAADHATIRVTSSSLCQSRSFLCVPWRDFLRTPSRNRALSRCLRMSMMIMYISFLSAPNSKSLQRVRC